MNKINEGMKCLKCGGLDVSLDFDTNELICNNPSCKNTAIANSKNRFDIEEYKQNKINEEENQINRLKMSGTQINIKTKMKNIQDLNKDINNDFSGIGL